MKKPFKEYQSADFAQINQEMLALWDEEQLFHRSLHQREDAPLFTFYEGPPSANGMPGIHHVIARSIKDIICRYKTMHGYRVDRRAGWDTHGLPVELGVEKKLGITKDAIGKTISVAEYNQTCRKEVMKYTAEWESLTNKMGYWVDMEHPYVTYKNKYIETLWYLLKELYKKGLLYKGLSIQPYSPAAGTGLSSHELNQPGCYRDVKDTVCTAQFRIIDAPDSLRGRGESFFLAWTTTPWTLPSNTALCVGPSIEYCAVETFNPYSAMPITVVLATTLLGSYFDAEDEVSELPETWDKGAHKKAPWHRISTCKGSDLVGIHYEQLIPWVNPGEGAFRVIPGDYVSTEDGTGIVHIAPTFGADDERVAKAAGIPPLLMIDNKGQQRPMVDLKGRFYKIEALDHQFLKESVNVPLYDTYAGRYVKKDYDPKDTPDKETLDVEICVMLKHENRVFKVEKHTHNYPHCWRTDKPILYYPLDSWFIRSTECREEMMRLNETIDWHPAAIGVGRFGKWLENLQDWNLSRSRYWGTPLPIWRTEDGDEEICIGSVEELYKECECAVQAGVMSANPLAGFTPGDYSEENYDKIDLHRPYVDEITLVAQDGKRPMRRESDLIDVWFDSGAMPFAQVHYPFEHREEVESGKVFPADFIAEGVDQTRGWFFTLHAIATMTQGSIAFRNVLVNGLVLDKDGNKMSKRLGNAVDPFGIIQQYGSDPLRWYMITNANPWENIRFDPKGVEEVSRKYFGTLYNTYQFFALYGNLDGFDPSVAQIPYADRPEIDRWILSRLNSLIKEVDGKLASYDPTPAGRAIENFVTEHLSNWYVRLSRKRFWAGSMTDDKLSAYQTLYQCLSVVAQLMAPIAPFYADRLYRDLHDDAASVHLTDYPVADEAQIDLDLERSMELAQIYSTLVLSLRRKVNIKVRQPLSAIMLPVNDPADKIHMEQVHDLLLSEVNVKEIRFVDPSDSIWVRTVKPDFKALGPKVGKNMKALAAQINALTPEQINELEQTEQLTLTVGDQPIVVDLKDVQIIAQDIPGWTVANEGRHTVALDITLTPELIAEGTAREFVNRIQNLRKQSGYEVNDHIELLVMAPEEVAQALRTHQEYIQTQVQADTIDYSEVLSDAEEIDLDGALIAVQISKI